VPTTEQGFEETAPHIARGTGEEDVHGTSD
jgi:hypothetical protein